MKRDPFRNRSNLWDGHISGGYDVITMGRPSKRAFDTTLSYLYSNVPFSAIHAVRTIPLHIIQEKSQEMEAYGEPESYRPMSVLRNLLEYVEYAEEALNVWTEELIEFFRKPMARTLARRILTNKIQITTDQGVENIWRILETIAELKIDFGGKISEERERMSVFLLNLFHDINEERLLDKEKIYPLTPFSPSRKKSLLPQEEPFPHQPERTIPSQKVTDLFLAEMALPPLSRRGQEKEEEERRHLARRVMRHILPPIKWERSVTKRGKEFRESHFCYFPEDVEALLAKARYYRKLLLNTVSEKIVKRDLDFKESETYCLIAMIRRTSADQYKKLLVFDDTETFIGFRYTPNAKEQLQRIANKERKNMETIDGIRKRAGVTNPLVFRKGLEALLRYGRPDIGDSIYIHDEAIVLFNRKIGILLEKIFQMGGKRRKEITPEMVSQAYTQVELQASLSGGKGFGMKV